jgi:hypothetical protein
MGVVMSTARHDERVGVEIRSAAPAAITAALHQAVDLGRDLLDDAELVADEVAYERWLIARRDWATETLRVLNAQFEAEAVEEFVHAVQSSGGTWERRLLHDVDATRNALELVQWLGTTLKNWRSDSDPNGRPRPHGPQPEARLPRGWGEPARHER